MNFLDIEYRVKEDNFTSQNLSKHPIKVKLQLATHKP